MPYGHCQTFEIPFQAFFVATCHCDALYVTVSCKNVGRMLSILGMLEPAHALKQLEAWGCYPLGAINLPPPLIPLIFPTFFLFYLSLFFPLNQLLGRKTFA